MKRIITYICALSGIFACQQMELTNVSSEDALLSREISPSCVIRSDIESSGPGTPMTRALVGQETTQSLRANFIKVDEVMPEAWTLSSHYDRTKASMPSLEDAQIVEADILSSPSSTDNYHLRSADFNPTLVYKFTTKEGSSEPELANRVGMVGWYPLTYDVPDGLGEEDAQAQFSASNSMKIINGEVCVEFKNKLDGQTDLMMTDYREGRMMMDGFKHKSAVNDVDIQPFGHSNPNTLDPDTFEYINYFTFHHYLSAVRIFIKATAEDRGKAAWTTIDDIMVMNQPTTAVVSLPKGQARGTGEGAVTGTTATLPAEGVVPIFGEVKEWSDYTNFDIVRTPMFTNNGPDATYQEYASLPYRLPTTGQVEPEYLGYALVKPDQDLGDGKTIQLKIFTDAGSYLVDLPEADKDGNHLLRPGKIYDYVISISAIGGIDIVIRNDDDDKYQALAPYNEKYQGYEYSNCYVITKEMIRREIKEHYSGFFFRAYVPGRGSKGDIAGDPYPADYKLEPAFVKIYTQSQNKPLEHCELVQGYVRFNLDGRTCINSNDEVEMFPGNALIAAYDENDNIIWSWHIWVVDEVNAYTVNGVTVLDRNLGATFAPKKYGEVWSQDDSKLLTTYGLYYQWGRKDPTAGPMSAYYDITDMRTNKYYTMDGPRNENAEVYMIGAAPTIEHSVQNPIVILSPSDVSPVYYNDWLWQKNDDLWGTVSKKKTIYDPCPYGYKVPDGELKKLFETSGWEFGGNNSWYGASYSNGSTYLFFPYAGWKGDDVKRVSRTHAWMKVGIAGDYQDATFDPKTFHRGRSLLARENFNVTIYGSNQNTYRKGLNYGYTNRTAATTVRCVRYEGEPLRPDDPIGARLD